jgi:hypothetical protein
MEKVLMLLKRSDFAIINRSFWPVYPVIGEALLQLAEELSVEKKVCVIIQDHADIRSQLELQKRGCGVDFYPCVSFSVSSSSILRRVLDAAFFMFWVFFCLLVTRPRKVYVSTDPPVLVPFVVSVYCRIFRSSYIYHLQDIHPEAANTIYPVNKVALCLLKKIDTMTLGKADGLITITDEMAAQICMRSSKVKKPVVISNPAIAFDTVTWPIEKIRGFAFCGNVGRLQRISLIVEAIEMYVRGGGGLAFAFAGAGIHAKLLAELAEKYENVQYLGQVSALEAAQLNADYQWALLPIEDEVTRYAFPSKSSSYVFSGALVAAICSETTSVAEWVRSNRLGIVVKPTVELICEFFWRIERKEVNELDFDMDRSELKNTLEFGAFLREMKTVIL